MKKVFALVLIIVVLSIFSKPAYALKKRIRAARAVYSSVKLSRGTHSVVATFYALPGVAKFDYTLSYSANGIPQGVVGSFVPVATGDSRDLYFGTCSHGVCTPHYGITNAALTVTATLKGGATYIKRYAIRNI